MRFPIWLPPLAALLLLLGAACNAGDDDDNGPGAKEQIIQTITGIVEEMIAGAMERTPEGLEDKFFPHVSGDYYYAGLDKAGYEAKALDDLADSPDLDVEDYHLTVTVEVADDRESAVARFTNVIDATLPAAGVFAFDVTLEGEDHGVAHFALEDDGQWRVIAGEAASSNWRAGGGEQSLEIALDGVTPDGQEAAPGQQVRLTGSFDVPTLAAGQQVFANLTLDWKDERANAAMWPYAEDSVWSAELTDSAGGAYKLDVSLPTQGTPSGLSVPASLPLGEDAVDAAISVVVVDGDQPLRYDSRAFSLPFQPLKSASVCEPGASIGVDGVWKITATFNDTPIVFELFDLALVGGDVYGAAGYASQGQGGLLAPIIFQVQGVVDGTLLSFGYSDDAISISYDATLSGLELADGTLTIDDGSGSPLVLDFTGSKLDNRCEGLGSDTLDGVHLSLDAPESPSPSWSSNLDGLEATLVGGGMTYSGFQFRNLLIAVDEAQAGPWLGLALYDRSGGYAAFVDGATPSEGTVEVIQ
jgi:hypothetical protein